MNILFVCLGNICRSPLAEVAFSSLVTAEGYGDTVHVDSAGTAGYHEGEAADPRSRACARRHGLEITHRARQVREADFHRFDLMVAMDESNAHELRRRAPDAAARRRVRLLREWDPSGLGEVPDPYYGDDSDFELVFEMCRRSMPALLHEILKEKRTW